MRRLFLVILIWAIILTGCAPRAVEKVVEEVVVVETAIPEPVPAGPTFLALGISWDPMADPALGTDVASFLLTEQLFLGLTDFKDGTDSEVIPELAKGWEVSADGLTWTFRLREDVIWSDGEPVTAHDVVYGIRRALDPATASDYAYILYSIRNAQAVHTGEEPEVDRIAMKAPDDYTVEFELEQPAGYFPAVVAMPVAKPVPQHVIEECSEDWAEPEHIVTNGPYELGEWVHEDHLALYKSPTYYDADNVQIDRVDFYVVPEYEAALTLYQLGQLDFIQVLRSKWPDVTGNPELSRELQTVPLPWSYYYGFNTTKPPFDEPLVRQAFSHAIDRQLLIDGVLQGGEVPAWTFAPPGVFGSPAEDPDYPRIDFDPDRARAMMGEAGYPGGRGLPDITLMHNTSEGHRKIAEFIQISWRENLGVEVNIVDQEWRAYLAMLDDDSPQIWRLGWSQDYPDEHNWVHENFHPTAGSNRPRWSGPDADEFARLTNEAAVVADPWRRKELYFEAEEILCVESAVIIPLYHRTATYLVKPSLKCTLSPIGAHHISTWITEREMSEGVPVTPKQVAEPDLRVVVVSPGTDQNSDRISDYLEECLRNGTYARPGEGDDRADVLIAFESAPTEDDLRGIQDHDGEVVEVWNELVYTVHAALPPDLDHILSYVESHARVIIVEENTPTDNDLEFSTAQIRARQVWSTYGYKGNPDYAIAILDGGIDDSHKDIPRLRAWKNTLDAGEAGAGKASGWDANGHGTHIAGIAAGRGTEADTEDFSVTFSGILSSTEGIGWFDYYPIRIRAAGKRVTATLNAKGGGAKYWINIRDESNTTKGSISGAQPLSASVAIGIVPPNPVYCVYPAYRVLFGTDKNDGVNTGGTAYYGQVEVPYDAWDTNNLLSGVAPNSQLVGVKVQRDDGRGDSADLIEGLTWVGNNAEKYKIVVANRSGSSSTVNVQVNTAARTLVNKGVSLVCSAGNKQGTKTITSPGMAPEVLTVGAVSDQDKLTKYSSVGPAGLPLKPDVLAPGGSSVTRNLITSVDTNDKDTCRDRNSGAKHLNADQYADDYCMMSGTSMAAPHVAGLVALIADAKKGGWTWGKKDDPMFAKMIILMTSVEVNAAENNTFKPPLGRGSNDNKEGYGRINADAAIEAVVESMDMTFAEKAELGANAADKKCWARGVSLAANKEYTFALDVPDKADFDLYLYKPFDVATMPYGEPAIAKKSVKAVLGEDEKITYTPGKKGLYYIVVKWVNGSGEFKLLRLPAVKAGVNTSLAGKTLNIDAGKAHGRQRYYIFPGTPAIGEQGGCFRGLGTGLAGLGEVLKEGTLDDNGKASVTLDRPKGARGFIQVIVCPGATGDCDKGAVSEVIYIEF